MRLRSGISLLSAVAEEAQLHLPRTQQQPALEALVAVADDVLSVLGMALGRALAASEGAARPPALDHPPALTLILESTLV